MAVETKAVSIKIKSVEKYVEQLLIDELSATIHFHTFEHTSNVKQAVIALAKSEKVSKTDREILTLAALFHDTGFTKTYKGYRDES